MLNKSKTNQYQGLSYACGIYITMGGLCKAAALVRVHIPGTQIFGTVALSHHHAMGNEREGKDGESAVIPERGQCGCWFRVRVVMEVTRNSLTRRNGSRYTWRDEMGCPANRQTQGICKPRATRSSSCGNGYIKTLCDGCKEFDQTVHSIALHDWNKMQGQCRASGVGILPSCRRRTSFGCPVTRNAMRCRYSHSLAQIQHEGY
jgi:hypothetical protein